MKTPAPYEAGESPLPQLAQRIEQLEKENRGLRGIAANATANFMDDNLRAGLQYEKRRRWFFRAVVFLILAAAGGVVMVQQKQVEEARAEARRHSDRAEVAETALQTDLELLRAEHDLRVSAQGVIESANRAIAELEARLEERETGIPVRRAVAVPPGDPER